MACATKVAQYQPRREVIATYLANLMQADFVEVSSAVATFGFTEA